MKTPVSKEPIELRRAGQLAPITVALENLGRSLDSLGGRIGDLETRLVLVSTPGLKTPTLLESESKASPSSSPLKGELLDITIRVDKMGTRVASITDALEI